MFKVLQHQRQVDELVKEYASRKGRDFRRVITEGNIEFPCIGYIEFEPDNYNCYLNTEPLYDIGLIIEENFLLEE